MFCENPAPREHHDTGYWPSTDVLTNGWDLLFCGSTGRLCFAFDAERLRRLLIAHDYINASHGAPEPPPNLDFLGCRQVQRLSQ
jgi:hypothetical protein